MHLPSQPVSLGRIMVFMLLAALPMISVGQQTEKQQKAIRYIQEHAAELSLTASDVASVRVTDTYVSKHNGVTHVWLQQEHNGIPVYNGLFGLHIDKNGKVWHTGHRFVQGLAEKVNTHLPALTAFQALEQAKASIAFSARPMPSLKRKVSEMKWLFEGGTIARSDISVEVVYQPLDDGSVRLGWLTYLDSKEKNDIWYITVDALTGAIINKYNSTAYCDFNTCRSKHSGSTPDLHESCSKSNTVAVPSAGSSGDGSAYRVFALPVESPIHGNRVLLTDPSDATASPFGWHDTNGQVGGEYNGLRGNNVWAYTDQNDVNGPDPNQPTGGAVGTPLTFDFPFDINSEAGDNLRASVTNLFYTNNAIHDIMYGYGFDEQSGNFQTNNYGKGGLGTDEVRAEGLDGGGFDNANFATPSDGGNGRMQMYLWTRQGGKVVKVNGPSAAIGSYEASVPNWGAPLSTTPVTGDGILVDDGTDIPNLGCNPSSTQNLTGKIVLIDRGICEFGVKAFNAQQRGAKGCIICNFENNLPNMGPGSQGGNVNIPVVAMQKKDCDILRQFSGAGLNISIGLPTNQGPEYYDGSFDNGIVIHEYFHGISNRLTGGPNNASCLNNAEQMGEGWSDFGTLILTARTGDKPEQNRGIGTFVQRQQTNGYGIRRYPYSTDMNTNPLTFGNVAENTEVHALGEVWTAVCWDMYWALVEKYGFDEDHNNKNSGNARAIQLVTDGMKLQPCKPGFIDGRNAILLADVLNYNGEDTCLIQRVFARRGFGYLADQGSPTNASDGVQHFEPRPVCIQELKLKKTVTPIIAPGGEATITLEVTNHKPTPVTGVVLRDAIGTGMSVVPGSATAGSTTTASEISWNIGSMAFGEVKTFTYKLKNNPTYRSLLYYADPMDTDQNWISLGNQIFFFTQSNDAKTGGTAFYAECPAAKDNASLEMLEEFTVAGTKPTLRFWTKFNTEKGTDGGWVEISDNQGTSWKRLRADKIIRDGYTGRLAYSTIAIPFLEAFSGNSNGWIQSYFDVEEYRGKKILVRYRMATNETNPIGGWYLDQTELIDLVNYNETARLTSAEGDNIPAQAPLAGIIVDTDGTINTNQLPDEVEMQVYPNPTGDLLFAAFGKTLSGTTGASVLAADGRLVMEKRFDNIQAGQVVQFDLIGVQSGIYLLKLVNGDQITIRKIVKQ